MKIKVELQAYLEQYSPDGRGVFEYDLPEEATVRDLIRALSLPEELASVIIVSNSAADADHLLREGDHVTVIPPLAGGATP